METFECLKTLTGHSDVVMQIEKLSINQIMSSSGDQTIKLWDIDTGICLKTFYNENEVSSLKILSDETLAAGSKKEIKKWNIKDGSCIKTLKGHSSWVEDLILLPNA